MILPLIMEQLLAILVGMLDTVMIWAAWRRGSGTVCVADGSFFVYAFRNEEKRCTI